MAGKTMVVRDKSGVITLETRDKKDKGQVKDEQGLRSRGRPQFPAFGNKRL